MPSFGSADNGHEHRETFETTQWSIVLAAGQDARSAQADAALETLCRTYWRPLFAFAQRRGHSSADAQDLVQGFFALILGRRDLRAVQKERGRFRSYLLTGFKHYLINDAERASASKRGGGQVPIPLDGLTQAKPVTEIATDEQSPDRAYDRQWALALLERVLDRIREELRADGRERHFECLQGFLTAAPTRSQAEIATELGLSEGAVKQAVFRLRQRYQILLRAEVAQTVATLADVDGELRDLVAALRG